MVKFTRSAGVSATRHDPPSSVKVKRLIPTPLSRTSSAPELSKRRLRGFDRPDTTNCAVHPLLTVGAL